MRACTWLADAAPCRMMLCCVASLSSRIISLTASSFFFYKFVSIFPFFLPVSNWTHILLNSPVWALFRRKRQCTTAHRWQEGDRHTFSKVRRLSSGPLLQGRSGCGMWRFSLNKSNPPPSERRHFAAPSSPGHTRVKQDLESNRCSECGDLEQSPSFYRCTTAVTL